MNRHTILQFFLLILACTLWDGSAYSYKKSVVLPPDVYELEFSPDQKYLVAASDTYLQLYNGVTGILITHIPIPDENDFQAFSFAQDSSMMGIGYGNGDILVIFQASNFSPAAGQLFETSQNLKINSLCFTADNRRLVFVNQNDAPKIGLIDLTSETSNITYNTYEKGAANFVHCSPIRSDAFMVGGGRNLSPSLTLYNFDIITNQIQIRQEFPLQQGPIITCGTYSPKGSFFYAITNDNILTEINPNNFFISEIELPLNQSSPITKIRINSNLDILALATDSVIYSVVITAGNQSDIYGDIQIQTYETMVSSVALSPNGGNIFYVSVFSVGEFLAECPFNQFWIQETGLCGGCSVSCSQCLNSPSECYSCVAGTYLQSNICESCMKDCSFCLGPTSCVSCRSTYTYKKGACLCEEGFFEGQKNGTLQCLPCPDGCLTCDVVECSTCKNGFEIDNASCVQIGGLPDWAIIIIVVAVLAVMLTICGFLSMHSKKKKQQQRLLNEESSV